MLLTSLPYHNCEGLSLPCRTVMCQNLILSRNCLLRCFNTNLIIWRTKSISPTALRAQRSTGLCIEWENKCCNFLVPKESPCYYQIIWWRAKHDPDKPILSQSEGSICNWWPIRGQYGDRPRSLTLQTQHTGPSPGRPGRRAPGGYKMGSRCEILKSPTFSKC